MAKSDEEMVGQSGPGGRGTKTPAPEVTAAEFRNFQTTVVERLQFFENAVKGLAGASALQTSIENSLHEISTKLDPLRDLGSGTEKLDDDQLTALDRIQDELKRPPTTLLQIVPRPPVADAPFAQKGTRS